MRTSLTLFEIARKRSGRVILSDGLLSPAFRFEKCPATARGATIAGKKPRRAHSAPDALPWNWYGKRRTDFRKAGGPAFAGRSQPVSGPRDQPAGLPAARTRGSPRSGQPPVG